MSKMDALRAMREARYAEAAGRSKQAAGQTARAKKPVPPVAPSATPRATDGAPEPEKDATEQLCGHRNMGGRTCTREAGHSAKSHRYS